MENMADVVLAIDPGREKCGVAVVERGPDGGFRAVYRAAPDVESAPALIAEAARQYKPDVILVGDGTNSAAFVRAVEGLGPASVKVVDEKFTTLQARCRYFAENPPRGLRRLIPISLQTPPRPFDDYVAVILAERFLAGTQPEF